jgi:chaperonin GroES
VQGRDKKPDLSVKGFGWKTKRPLSMKLSPLENTVVLKPFVKEKTAGGIIIPDSAQENFGNEAIVVAIGPGKRMDNGDLRTTSVKPGDHVAYWPRPSSKLILDEEEFTIIMDDQLMGIIHDGN